MIWLRIIEAVCIVAGSIISARAAVTVRDIRRQVLGRHCGLTVAELDNEKARCVRPYGHQGECASPISELRRVGYYHVPF